MLAYAARLAPGDRLRQRIHDRARVVERLRWRHVLAVGTRRRNS
jgi:hypothetical protein